MSPGINRLTVKVANTSGLVAERTVTVHYAASRPNVWAVVVGINDYPNLPKLKYAVNDAREFHRLLVERNRVPAENVVLLLDEVVAHMREKVVIPEPGELALVERLASWKINQVQLYLEHTFAYHAHRVVWEHASPFTGEEILALDAFCRERFIELVPNQNSFGHFERWLRFPEYRHLAECPDKVEAVIELLRQRARHCGGGRRA